MSDNDGKKTLGLGGSRPSNVKQSFSHGRTKNVVVETKRKRVVVPKPSAGKPVPSGPTGRPIGGDPSKRPAGISDVELERRMKALAMAKAREAEEAAKREAEEKERAAARAARAAPLHDQVRGGRLPAWCVLHHAVLLHCRFQLLDPRYQLMCYPP